MGSIKKNFLYSSVLTTANYVFPLIVYPYVARVIGVDNIGVVNFVDSIANYFILFSSMGINVMGIREVAAAKGNKQKLSEVFNSLFSLTLIMSIIAVAVLAVATVCVAKLRAYPDMLVFAGFKILFNCVLIQWFFQGLEEFRFITVRAIAVKLLYVVCVFVFVRKAEDFWLFYLLTVLSMGVNALINIIFSTRTVKFGWKYVKMRGYVKPFFTIGIYAVLTSMYTTFNVAFLGFVSTDAEVGYYTTATKIFTIVLSLYSAFTGVMLPRMSSLISDGKREEFKEKIYKSTDVLLAFSLPIMIYFLFFAGPIIRIIAGPGYEGAIVPMQIVMALVFLCGYDQILVIQTLMPNSRDKVVSWNAAAGATLGVVLNILLVPRMAAVGSALVLVLCECLIMVLSQTAVTRMIGLHFRFKTLLRYVLAYLPVIACFALVLYRGENGIPMTLVCGAVILLYTIAMHIFIFKEGLVGTMLRKMCRMKPARCL